MKGAFRPNLSVRCHGPDVRFDTGGSSRGRGQARSERVMRFKVLGPLEIETEDGRPVVTGRQPGVLLVASAARQRQYVAGKG